jgi:HSP20 family protein
MPKDLVRLLNALFPCGGQGMQDVCLHPPADIYRTPWGWLVKLDLAGVRPEDLSISAYGQTLTIRGRRRDRHHEDSSSCYALEIAYCQFERSLTLPCRLDDARISAELRDGMLWIRIQTEEISP